MTDDELLEFIQTANTRDRNVLEQLLALRLPDKFSGNAALIERALRLRIVTGDRYVISNKGGLPPICFHKMSSRMVDQPVRNGDGE